MEEKTRYTVYFSTGVESFQIHEAKSLAEATRWVADKMKGRTVIDDEHYCSEELYATSRVARYQVYYGEPIIIEDGVESSADPVWESEYFYRKD